MNWESYWREPELPELDLHPQAAKALWLTAHMQLGVLVAGPQGSGKTTFARAAYALSPKPDQERMMELIEMFGDEVLQSGWRPLEQPHHTLTPQAMVGGGNPVQPGVITRAHGGVLIMDEFLEFPQSVLEALREPVENGTIEIARRGTRERLPAKFQLIATTNLCPCGRLKPNMFGGCNRTIASCRVVCRRLSGPVLDRFDLMVFSHDWLTPADPVPLTEVKATLQRMASFRDQRGLMEAKFPEWFKMFAFSHRRRRSLLRIARGLADFDESVEITEPHLNAALYLATEAMDELRRLHA